MSRTMSEVEGCAVDAGLFVGFTFGFVFGAVLVLLTLVIGGIL